MIGRPRERDKEVDIRGDLSWIADRPLENDTILGVVRLRSMLVFRPRTGAAELDSRGAASWMTTTEPRGRGCHSRDRPSLEDEEEEVLNDPQLDAQLESRGRRRSMMSRVPDADEDLDEGE
ncbi:hypothetical protein MMC11_006462 [Xylographa trunciseda]|nr:hypothetical protein [Xylographa trunciseda]